MTGHALDSRLDPWEMDPATATTDELLKVAQEHGDYEHGWSRGVYQFAVMRDGRYYVGSTGTTLRDALAEMLVERGAMRRRT